MSSVAAWMSPLPSNLSKSELMEILKQYHPVECKIFSLNNGCAHIFFETESDRDKAISSMDGRYIKGYRVRIKKNFKALREEERTFSTYYHMPYDYDDDDAYVSDDDGLYDDFYDDFYLSDDDDDDFYADYDNDFYARNDDDDDDDDFYVADDVDDTRWINIEGNL